MKACESCSSRVRIGKNHLKLPIWRRAIGIPLVYLPLLTFPFVIINAYLTYWHLRMVGGQNIKTWSDFVPDRKTHRYELKSQLNMHPSFSVSMAQFKTFWFFNCTWYCPYSVALLDWHSYLIQVVENWWCPFTHERKQSYMRAAIDKSFWHLYPEELCKMEPEDQNNPIWNEEAGDVDVSTRNPQ